MRREVKKSSLVWVLSFGLLAACQKAPIVEAPIPVTPVIEDVEDSKAQPEVVQPEVEAPVKEVVEEAELDSSLEYSDAVNNAVALLTGDLQAVESGLKQLEQLPYLLQVWN